MILIGYITSLLYGVLCLLASALLYKLGLPKKYTRKAVHILVGAEWFILYHLMGAGVHFLLVCLIFLAMLAIVYKGRLMPMIASDGENAPGTVYYAAAMTGVALVGCFVPEVMLPFGIGVMCTSVGDGFAGVVGQLVPKKYNPEIFGAKTVLGSLANFVASLASALALSAGYGMELDVWQCAMLALLSVELELVTGYGLDNISVTWGITALAYSFMYFANIGNYILPILATPLIVLFALWKKALTRGGIIAALILDVLVSLAFGNFGFLVLCAFFIGSIIVDKIKKHNKKSGRIDENAKGDCRDYMQVLANGLVPLISAIAFLATSNNVFIVPFAAGLAEAFADTAASGIGSLSGDAYDPFRRKKCVGGLSGGMTVVGTLASLVASLVIALLSLTLSRYGYGTREFAIVAFSGFLGAVFDSFLGSLVQVKYICESCGTVTEREQHCGAPTVKLSGVSFIDNDLVNIFSAAFSAIVATALVIIF